MKVAFPEIANMALPHGAPVLFHNENIKHPLINSLRHKARLVSLLPGPLARAPVDSFVINMVSPSINDALKFAEFGTDRFERFQSDVAVYHDVFADFSTNEPIIDGTVSLLLLLSAWEEERPCASQP